MKKILIILIINILTINSVFAVDYDSSIDADIRKQYEVDELPALPKSAPSKTQMPKATKIQKEQKDYKNVNYSGKTYTIKGGTKVTLISKSAVSNWTQEGAKISFISQNPINTKEGVVIPAGTLFKATVINSHPPQMTGNGGLIELRVNEIYYNGLLSAINTKIESINSKKTYKNKVKGKRKYFKNCAKAMTPGKKTYKAMAKVSKALLPYPIINILSLIPFTIGATVYVVNIPFAPIASAFMKGASVSLPSNTVFQIHFSGSNSIRG